MHEHPVPISPEPHIVVRGTSEPRSVWPEERPLAGEAAYLDRRRELLALLAS